MIEINNLAFSYGANPVLSNITMSLKEGRIYGLLGENGVGKTTLLTILAGLKKPLSGTITTDGEEPYKRNPSHLENQYYLPDDITPYPSKAIQFATTAGEFWPSFSMQKFEDLMKLFEVDPQQKMSRMSTGQLKKTFISFALATGAKHLFLDEPTNGLDIPSKAQFRSALMKYTTDESIVVISTHQVRDLENIIDPIIILDRRDVLLNASLQEISAKLYFDYGTVIKPEALYVEQIPGGCIQVLPNTTGEESKVNIEALFNTVHNHKELFKNL